MSVLPHGTGKQVRVLVLCTPDAEAAAKEAGADYVGLDEYIEKIKGGSTPKRTSISNEASNLVKVISFTKDAASFSERCCITSSRYW